jgi:dTDP-4-dehydrorhamnose 3,5-epimerase
VIFTPTILDGVVLVDPDRRSDERGYFARTWCRREFEEAGLDARLVQCSVSHNLRRHTLRGMHWQDPPHAEVKLVRCTRGAILDVIVDLRPDSQSYLCNLAVELDENNGRALYVPEGMAHGFLTLADNTDVSYQMSSFHEPSSARGARWNDPAFAIDWPTPAPILHPRDASYPDFVAFAHR